MEQHEHPLTLLQKRLLGLKLKGLSSHSLLSDDRVKAAGQLARLCNLGTVQLETDADLFDVNARIFVAMMTATLPPHFGIQADKIVSLASTGQTPQTMDDLVMAWTLFPSDKGYNALRKQMRLHLIFAANVFSSAQYPMDRSMDDYMGVPANGNQRQQLDNNIVETIRTSLGVAFMDVAQGQSFGHRVDRFIQATFIDEPSLS